MCVQRLYCKLQAWNHELPITQLHHLTYRQASHSPNWKSWAPCPQPSYTKKKTTFLQSCCLHSKFLLDNLIQAISLNQKKRKKKKENDTRSYWEVMFIVDIRESTARDPEESSINRPWERKRRKDQEPSGHEIGITSVAKMAGLYRNQWSPGGPCYRWTGG